MGAQVSASGEGYRLMENGILVPSKDARAMALALIRLKNERPAFAAMAARAGRFARTRFATERVVRETAALYRSLMMP
jgi:glycosyltransferase involved in cell wall biosynthesis